MRFNENSRLGDVISEHYQLLLILSRFGITLGFGDKTVRAVCADSHVDSKTFLAVANYVVNGDGTVYHDIDTESMIRFLRLSHQYYFDFLLPELRNSLKRITDDIEDTKLATLLIKLFDNYASSVRRHLEYEDRILFDYTENLLGGNIDDTNLSVSSIIGQHDSIDGNLSELKNVMIRYLPAPHGMVRRVNQVLYDIFAFEEDIKMHSDIESNLFIPLVIDLENKVRKAK